MIKVNAEYAGDSFLSLTIKGHGGEESGTDLVCAGVSTCFIGALNALRSQENYDISVKSGNSYIKCIAENTMHDEVVLETLLTQIGTLEARYPENIRLKISKKEGNK